MGWNEQVFTGGNYFFWVPVLGPMLGSALGTFTYSILIGNNWPTDIKL
jgi:glycerol uptake facilitator-like aquaporin